MHPTNQGTLADAGGGLPLVAVDEEWDDALRVTAADARALATDEYAWARERRAWARELRADIAAIRAQSAAAEHQALVARAHAWEAYVATLEAWIRTDGIRALAEAAGTRALTVRRRVNELFTGR
jgi:hypothetical protein